MVKALGRLRKPVSLLLLINPLYVFIPPKRKVGFIGAGQFAFATVGYFLVARRLGRLEAVYDLDFEKATSLASMYGCSARYSHGEVISDVDIVYVLSNHSTHTEYAIQALESGKKVYCEKPISVSLEQLARLYSVVRGQEDKFSCGYNRPHSHIMKYTKKHFSRYLDNLPVTLSCYVRGHMIPEDHWYRNDDEGTRVCGNLGHWIDLFISVIWPRFESIEEFSLNITSSSPSNPDDNCLLTITTNEGDLFSVVISSRNEPFEGIDESINLQAGELNLKVDDFRSAVIHDGSKRVLLRKFCKDVGHATAIGQPFNKMRRRFLEYFVSSYFTISFANMIQNGQSKKIIHLDEIKEFFK